MCCEKIREAFAADEKCFDNLLSAKESGRKFSIQIPRKSEETFCRARVDACLIADSEIEKCDFVFLRCLTGEFFFVELKGSNVEKGYSQIISTIKIFRAKKLATERANVRAFLVASKVKLPKANAALANLKKDFAKNFGWDLVFKTDEFVLNLA